MIYLNNVFRVVAKPCQLKKNRRIETRSVPSLDGRALSQCVVIEGHVMAPLQMARPSSGWPCHPVGAVPSRGGRAIPWRPCPWSHPGLAESWSPNSCEALRPPACSSILDCVSESAVKEGASTLYVAQ